MAARLTWTTTLVMGATLLGCTSGDDVGSPRPTDSCPGGEPVRVVVTVDQWGDIVGELGGACAEVTTIIEGSSADPHDYELTPGDSATFEDAQLVVLNGLDYDPWANQAIETLDAPPSVVDGGKVVGLEDGDNPHIWYGPDYVRQVADAVTSELRRLAPETADYFDDRQRAWRTSMQRYDAEIARINSAVAGRTFGATEPVVDYLAAALGLTNATPAGYQNAALNETDPSPADIAEFEQALRDRQLDVLFDNTQTEGPTPAQIRGVAEDADVPVVEVSETVPPGTDSFVEWQVRQLTALASALGV